ncbi:hypothetical protein [Clostridium sp.]|uniref:hypothetical protein n=1 Tax=Clostridium sp. TaxID=1506 RepID=UPI002582E876|nr:hypothetical protein [Clostridium sp.]MDF2504574.1 tRNA-binding protein [Clostridium sp.]
MFVVNLAPKKMAGEFSEGMLFDIGYADGIVPVLAQQEKTVPNEYLNNLSYEQREQAMKNIINNSVKR